MEAIDDPTGPLGIRLLSQREGERLRIEARAATLLVPVHAGLAEIASGGTKHVVDRAAWMLLPAGTRAVVRALFERCLSEVQLLPRTVWVNEICHRYLFERAVCRKSDNVATHFLESEIVKEVYFACRTAAERTSHVARPSAVIEREHAAPFGREGARRRDARRLYEPRRVLPSIPCALRAEAVRRPLTPRPASFRKEGGGLTWGFAACPEMR